MNDRIIELYIKGLTVMEIVRDLDLDVPTVAQCVSERKDLLAVHQSQLKLRCQQLISDGYSINAISKLILMPVVGVKKILEKTL